MGLSRHHSTFRRRAAVAIGIAIAAAGPAFAQAPAASQPRPDDTPSVKVGATIFADYTVQQQPKGTDSDGNSITPSAFNVTRSYITITGNISHVIAFRITPDIVRETGGSSLNGSYTFRLK